MSFRKIFRFFRQSGGLFYCLSGMIFAILACCAAGPGNAASSGENRAGTNAAIREFEPALAVRASACITCHARIHSSIITDFGYRDPYFFGKTAQGRLGPFNGNIYGDFYGGEPGKTAWLTAEIDGKIIVPRAGFDFNLRNVAGSGQSGQPAYAKALQADTLAHYLQALEAQKPHPSAVIEKEGIFIGAPDAATLEARFGIPSGSGTRFRYVKSDPRTSPDIRGIGLVPGGNYYTNTQTVVCDGDLFIRGTLFLNRLMLSTRAGCRIYATGPIFVQNAITQSGGGSLSGSANLQLVSSEAILLGVGNKSCDPKDTDSPLARRLFSGYAVSTFETREAQRESIPPKKAGQSIYDQALSIPLLEDASCRDDTIGFSGLLLDAPQVHSRYKGRFQGLVIAEVVLFRLGKGDFEFDPVFRKVPVLPLLKDSDYLQVQSERGVPPRLLKN